MEKKSLLESEGDRLAPAIVIILFKPDEADLAHVAALAAAGHSVFAVGNGLTRSQANAIEGQDRVFLIDNPGNVGLARALNQGLEMAFAAGANYVLTLDQDSRIEPTLPTELVSAASRVERDGLPLASIGPVLRDVKAPAAAVSGLENQEVATIATSGSLITRRAWLGVGPMREDLFIDGIDHEWCFRAIREGYRIVVAPHLVMRHDMGDGGLSIFGRYKPIHRSSIRHYFIVRNTLWLARCDHIPPRWRISELLKLGYRIPAYLVFSTHKRDTATNLVRGLIDGIRGTSGLSPVGPSSAQPPSR